MTTSDLLGVAGLIIGVIGTVVAALEAKKNKSIRNHMKVEVWGDYHRACIVFGCTDLCLRALKTGNILEATQEAGKAQGAAQTIYASSIENIQHCYSYTSEDIEKWLQSGKILAHQATDFHKYAEK